jgi:hypothetical protein
VGDPNLNVSFGPHYYHEHQVGRDEVLLCPPFDSTFVEISVYSFNTFSSYDVIVTEYPDSISPVLDILNFQYSYNPDLNLFLDGYSFGIGDGVSANISSNTVRPVLQYFIFGLQSLNLSCFVHFESRGTTHLGLIRNERNFMYVTPFSYNGRSLIDISVCDFNASMISGSQYNYLITSSDLEFQVFVTTNNRTEIVPLQSLYLLDSLYILSSGISVSFPASIPCGVAHIWSSFSSSPFNPPQDFLFASTVSFHDISWSLPNRSNVDESVLYTYLLLDDDFNGTAEEVMWNFTFSIGPSLVNADGQRLTSNGAIRPELKMNITCDNGPITVLLDDLNNVLDTLVSLKENQISESYSMFVASDIIQSNQTWIACGEQIEYMYAANESDAVGGITVCSDWICTNLTFENYL